MWHPEKPQNVTFCIALISRIYGTSCHLKYQMIKIIIKHSIHIYMCHSGRSIHIMFPGYKVHVAELPHDTLKQMRILRREPRAKYINYKDMSSKARVTR